MFTANEAMWILAGYVLLRFMLPALGLLTLGTWLQRRHPDYPYS